MRRLFLAAWPDVEQVDQLLYIQDRLQMEAGRLITAENFHITLLFLGDVRVDVEDCLVTSCKLIKQEPIELTLSQLGYFPKSQILWYGPVEVPERLRRLHTRLRSGASQCRIRGLSKRFVPHVSLVRRCIKPKADPGFTPFSWRISEFYLVESVLRRDGARYEILESFPLSACS